MPTPIGGSGKNSGNVSEAGSRSTVTCERWEGWLCPALNLYYPDAPKKLYVQVREAK